jgi:eukaryotic-like serine/threonine-protein kinase
MARAGNIVGGKYRLLSLIGEGSMGAVWKAVHETLDRPFAVKFLKDYDANSARLEERFIAEARLAASVQHRSVVDVIDFGFTDEGTPYMVMEYLNGLSLAERLGRKPVLSVLDFLRLMHQVLGGLEAVHRAGILHRDLKPENIVLCPEGGRMVPKLIDFGISRALDPPAGDRAGRKTERLTSPGTTVGTPWYMAPEQARASPTIDWRGDIYAAGVIIYEVLTGQLPFDHEDARMVLMMVAAGGAPPVGVYRPDLPRALSDLVARAMALDPYARFPTAAAFAIAVRAVARDVPKDAVCRVRGEGSIIVAPQPEAPISVTALESQCVETATVVSTGVRVAPGIAKHPTLPLALARLGFARMPSRSVLISAGVVMATGTVALVGFLRLSEPKADARPRSPGLAAAHAIDLRAPNEGARSQGGKPTTLLTTTAVAPRNVAPPVAEPALPTGKPRKARSKILHAPEVFRSPGF